MRSIRYDAQTVSVEVLSLTLPPTRGLMSGGLPVRRQSPSITVVAPVELPIGARMTMDNADRPRIDIEVLGCAQRGDGKYVIVGSARL